MENSSADFQVKNKAKFRTIIIFTSFAISLVLGILLLHNIEAWQETTISIIHRNDVSKTMKRIGNIPLDKYIATLDNKAANTHKKIQEFLPTQPYIVINSTLNNFQLFNSRRELIREGLVSTGSFTILRAGKNKQWMFKTPRGQHKVLRKTKDPVWKKPDWSFIEDGLKVPSSNHPSRFEEGTLGDYSMSLGDGYMIHGTLYKRFLGLPVTHGCIRMGDDDLEEVFRTLQLGSKVYIY